MTVRVSKPHPPSSPQSPLQSRYAGLLLSLRVQFSQQLKIEHVLMVLVHVRVLVILQEDLNLVIHLVPNVLAAETR